MNCCAQIAVALGRTVYMWNAGTGGVDELCSLPNEGDYVCSVAWSADGAYLAVGTSDAKVGGRRMACGCLETRATGRSEVCWVSRRSPVRQRGAGMPAIARSVLAASPWPGRRRLAP